MLPCGSPASVCCMFVLLLRDNNNFTHRVHQATTVSTLDSHVLATLDGVALSAMSPSARSAAATDAAWHPMCAHATRAGKEAHAAHVRMRLAFLWIQLNTQQTTAAGVVPMAAPVSEPTRVAAPRATPAHPLPLSSDAPHVCF